MSRRSLTIGLRLLWCSLVAVPLCGLCTGVATADDADQHRYFETHVRPLLAKHCYECHSEQAGEQQGGLLLDRASGWLKGGSTNQAVVPGQPEMSLLIEAVKYQNDNLQMPPEGPLTADEIAVLERWIAAGAAGPAEDLGETEFSRLGDQPYLFEKAASHWSFQPLSAPQAPPVADRAWNESPIDRFVFQRLDEQGLSPSPRAPADVLLRRLSFDLTGLPPSSEAMAQLRSLSADEQRSAITQAINVALESPAFGEHLARLWLDVARYANTEGTYRPDTRTPKYMPFAFAYRDYVITAFNNDKPIDQFFREQLAADLMGLAPDAPELAALGFLAMSPRVGNDNDTIADLIDATSRGMLGLTVACAQCHDHKLEAIPTADYYSLFAVVNSIRVPDSLDEKASPERNDQQPPPELAVAYQARRAEIDAQIQAAGNSKAKGNNRSVAERIRETDLAVLLTFDAGAPLRMMVVEERPKPVDGVIFVRGEPSDKGDRVPRRFLQLLDPAQTPFTDQNSGRLDLAERITAADNPLTARVFVNRVWGALLGSYLVDTPSDFGLQGSQPTNQELLDWLARDFMDHGWSLKHLVRTIVSSQTYQQSSADRASATEIDPVNRSYWRANRKRLSIEQLRDSLLAVTGELDRRLLGRPEALWGTEATRRRAIYGFINRFNLDPTLRNFDFPSPQASSDTRPASVIAPQSLFTLNSPFVISRAEQLTQDERFLACSSDADKVEFLFRQVFGRPPEAVESSRICKLVASQQRLFPIARSTMTSFWPLAAQALLMSNEFQFVD